MSTRLAPAPAKKISSWVRPGVCEVRASALRPASALIRLDLPTLERPAKAISIAPMGGSTANDPAAATKRHSPANNFRPASISSGVGSVMLIRRLENPHSSPGIDLTRASILPWHSERTRGLYLPQVRVSALSNQRG